MSRFLKLKNQVINTSTISRVQHFVNQSDASYLIHLTEMDLRGFNFFGFGVITNKEMRINVQLSTDTLDYLRIHKWVEEENDVDFLPKYNLADLPQHCHSSQTHTHTK